MEEFVTEAGHYPTVPGQRDPRWYVTDEVSAVDAERCEDEWDFGGRVGTVQCSRQKGHEGSHFANGENFSSDYGFMLNTIYRLQDELKEYHVEQASLSSSLIKARKELGEVQEDLELEKKMHHNTLNVLEKALATIDTTPKEKA